MIIKRGKNKKTEFSNLECSDIFEYNNKIYMKISYFHANNSYNVNAYNISDKNLELFSLDTDVYYIPSELILHEQGWEDDEQKN